MAVYGYRAELKRPGPLHSIDFSNPKLSPMIQMLTRNMQQAVQNWEPPKDMQFQSLTAQSWDGNKIGYYIIAPKGEERQLPGMLYCHGGGFFLPLQPMMLQLAALYACRLNMRVFLPEYRLLPKYPNPYPFNDCLAIWDLMTQQARQLQLDKTQLMLYGESAGGALAAGLAHMIRDRGKFTACGQLLIYPVLDDRCDKYPSMTKYSHAAWPKSSNEYMWQKYLISGYADLEKYVVPMRGNSFKNLPAAYVEPQEIDTLCDEAIAYAERLYSAGVPVELNLVSGSYHGFDSDLANTFVRQVIEKRIHAMEKMLSHDSNNEPLI